jgi:hypothetical protein
MSGEPTDQMPDDEGGAVVTRKIMAAGALSPADVAACRDALGALPGVLQVDVTARRRALAVRYLATRCDYGDLLAAVAQAGVRLPSSRWARLRSAWLRMLDSNAKENAKTPPASCCNRPPPRSRH